MSKVIAFLHWFCITTPCDWLIKFAPLSQPIRCKSKTNRALLARVFLLLVLVTCVFALNSDWFVALFAPVVIGQGNYCTLVLVLQHSIENRSIVKDAKIEGLRA